MITYTVWGYFNTRIFSTFLPPWFLAGSCLTAHIGLSLASVPGCPWTLGSPGLSPWELGFWTGATAQFLTGLSMLPSHTGSFFPSAVLCGGQTQFPASFDPLSSPLPAGFSVTCFFFLPLLMSWVMLVTYKFIPVIENHVPTTKPLK